METNLFYLIIFLVGGIYLLIKGADHLVDGSCALAFRFRIPPLVVGLTVVSFGTSCPELATSLTAALMSSGGANEAADVAVGNVVGSNICNTALILGMAALFSPIAVRSSTQKFEIPMMLLFSGLLVFFAWGGDRLGTVAGITFLGVFGFFVLFVIHSSIRGLREGKESELSSHSQEDLHTAELSKMSSLAALGWIVLGLILLIVGAQLLLNSATTIAIMLKVPESIIGLTIVAIGTSLPELAASVVAAKKGHSDIALGNVLGSNIFNIGLILGIPSVSFGLNVAPEIANRDIWVMAGLAILIVPFALSDKKIDKAEGIFLVVAYFGYLSWLVVEQLL